MCLLTDLAGLRLFYCERYHSLMCKYPQSDSSITSLIFGISYYLSQIKQWQSGEVTDFPGRRAGLLRYLIKLANVS